MWRVLCACVRSVGDKQVYLCKQSIAAKRKAPRVWLRIQLYKKIQWHATHAHANTHVQWFLSITRWCTVNPRGMLWVLGERWKREATDDLKSPKSTTDEKLLLVFDFVSSSNLADILRESNTSVHQCKERAFALIPCSSSFCPVCRITHISHEQVSNGRRALAWSENMVDEWKPWELPDCPELFSDNSQLSDVQITDRKRGLWSLMEPCRPCWNDIHGLYLHKHNYGGYFGRRQSIRVKLCQCNNTD